MKNDRLFESLNIAELMVRKKVGDLSADEEQTLIDWANLSKENSKVYAEISDGKLITKELDQLKKYNSADAYAKFKSKISEQESLLKPQKFDTPLIGIAASLFIFILAGLGYYFYQKSHAEHVIASNSSPVVPAGPQAVLTLADGKTIQLSDMAKGELLLEGAVKLNKTKEGELVYAASENSSTALNKIETPRGGTYVVNLPDGTKIWLNAASSLKYPVSFNGLKERRVELIGEAYFEIAKQKTPFIVSTTGLNTEVLGTHFNINAYPEEAVLKTTLMEGSIKVSIPESNYSTVLKPGYEAVVGPAVKGIEVEKVDLSETVGWKNGSFVFIEQDLGSIMRELSRWYNVEVEFADPEKKKLEIGGSISRFSDIKKVLKMLEMTGLAKFKVVGHQVIVQ